MGTNQKGAAMWDRILEVWRESMGAECNFARNNNSLQLKWSKIQGAVSKFHSLYERLERHPQSGTNSEDLIINSMRAYEDLHATPFKFLDCWKILIKNPKWCSKELTKAATSTKQGVEHKMSTMTGEVMETNGNGDVDKEGKNAKKKKRKLNEEKGVVDALNRLQCTLEKQINVNQANLEIKRENEEKELKLREEVMRKELELKEKAQKMKEEMYRTKMREQRRQEKDRIMNQDLSKLSPTRRAYYELRKIEVLKELENEFPHGSNMLETRLFWLSNGI
ncbi:ATP synthase subunit b [Striga asiatica]|uniref:ATP synthase subunit b n=1 Tax=Striga asiatica TaxID=4170 RepID=A0A5A7PKM3_STRAF|nr:ATP synthase subunit b [Striga asiatica]